MRTIHSLWTASRRVDHLTFSRVHATLYRPWLSIDTKTFVIQHHGISTEALTQPIDQHSKAEDRGNLAPITASPSPDQTPSNGGSASSQRHSI